MNWLEINGYFMNLDNIAFITEDKTSGVSNRTMIGFIGGQSMNVDMPKQTVVALVVEHHRKRGLLDVPSDN